MTWKIDKGRPSEHRMLLHRLKKPSAFECLIHQIKAKRYDHLNDNQTQRKHENEEID